MDEQDEQADQEDQDAATPRPSRGAKKRAVAMFEALALEVADMPLRQYAQLKVPEVLLEEVERARRTKGGSSRKRQAKFLAGFLRRHEQETQRLKAQLERLHISHHADTVLFHSIEELRDRLCVPDQAPSALDEVRAQFPDLDFERLDQLMVKAHRTGDRRYRREIFRLLREMQVIVERPGVSSLESDAGEARRHEPAGPAVLAPRRSK